MTEQKKEKLRQIVYDSRARILAYRPVYALLLMCLTVVIDENIGTVSVNENCIFVNPNFLQKLHAKEVDFVLLHQLYHVINGDIWREEAFANANYHHACDMIINRKLLKDDGTEKSYSHLGRLFSLGAEYDPDIVKPLDVYYSLFYNVESFSVQDRKRLMFDSDDRWDEHYDHGQFADILIEAEKEIDESFFAKKEKEKLGDKPKDVVGDSSPSCDDGNDNAEGDGEEFSMEREIDINKKKWQKRVELAFGTVKKSGGNGVGFESDYLNLQIAKLKKSQLDWRAILNDVLSEEVCDYSFSPVDKRFSESDFFLPDFNENDTVVKDVLFMVDTSASIDVTALTMAFSEIKGAIEQFKGRLCGKLGFFDWGVKKVIDFDSVTNLEKITPVGGGGTDFYSVFDYVNNKGVEQISQLIILTDGEASFPDEVMAKGLPVLWLINNEDITPPWGKVARIKKEKT